MIKKILLIIWILFISTFQNTFANETNYWNPSWLMINLPQDYRLCTNLNEKNSIWSYVCSEIWENYIESSLESFSGSVYNSNIPWNWSIETWNYSCFSEITCTDVWISQNQNEGLNANWEPLETDIPVFVINNWVVYINKDNFFYMLVASAVILLLFRSVIFIFLTAFNIWKNLASWKGLRINKK